MEFIGGSGVDHRLIGVNVIAVRFINVTRVGGVGLVSDAVETCVSIVGANFVDVVCSAACAGGRRMRARDRAEIVVVLSGRVISFGVGNLRRISEGVAIHGVGKRVGVIELS